jgi:hypothetical protein
MAAEGADAAEDKYKGHKRPHELIPGYVKDKEKMEVSTSMMQLLLVLLWGPHLPFLLVLAQECIL